MILANVIYKSKLPSAEKFENWLLEIVLPSIRKNGGYITHEKLEYIFQDTYKTIYFLEKMIKAISKKMTAEQMKIHVFTSFYKDFHIKRQLNFIL